MMDGLGDCNMHLTEALILKTIFKNFSRIIFLISFQTIICAGNIFGADNILSPEVTVKNYVDAYIAQDWEACTGYLHPEMLQKLHNRIIDMFDEVSTFTRDKLLKQYRVRSVRELQAIPPRHLYILYLKNRWDGLDSQSVEDLSTTKLSVIKTIRINNDECQVECKSTVTINNQTYDKVEAYYLKKYQDRWKIYSTEGLRKLDKQMLPEQKTL